MAPARVDALRARAAADAWDTDAAAALATEAAAALAWPEAQPELAALRERFPTSARLWRLCADAAQRGGVGTDGVRAVYEEAVAACAVSVELWRDFLRWSERWGAAAGGGAGGGGGVGDVFERAVAACGVDLGSDKLWADYLAWVRREPGMSESARRDLLRKVYQRAVRMPMNELDGFWAQYRQFEETSNSNKELGRALLAEAQPRYVAARAEFRSRRIRREGLALTAWAAPPRGRPKEAGQASQWRKFVRTERANVHVLPPPDLHQRVVHAYECALMPLYRYPDVWIDYCSYMADTAAGRSTVVEGVKGAGGGGGGGGKGGRGGKGGQAASAAASAAAAAAAGEKAGPVASVADFEKVAERAMKAMPECVAVFHHVSWLWMRAQNSGKALAVLDTLAKTHPSPLAFVHLMRLTRKVSGKDAARKVFAKARRDSNAANPVVYIAAAQMEFIVNKDNKVARNVFEFGLKYFPNDALMVHEFVQWLWGLGDFDHLRVVLKRVMPAIKGPVALVCALWERWIELEEAVGDVASVDAVEQQWKDGGSVGRAHDSVSDAVRRSRYLGLEGMREEELAIITGPGGVGRLGGVGGPAAAAGGASGGVTAGGGRRDPRTGRIVGRPAVSGAASGAGGAGASAGSGGGSGVAGGVSGAAGRSAVSGAPGRGAGGVGAAKGGSSASGPGGGAGGGASGGVAAGGGGPGGGGGGAGAGGGAAGMGVAAGGSAAGGSRTASGLAVVTGMDDIESNLRRMAAGMQSINAPPPDYDSLVQIIMKTPDSFAATPVGGASLSSGKLDGNGSMMNAGAGNAASGAVGKKRKGDEMMGTTMQQQQPPQDLFRARQAAKQSRMR